MRIAEVYRVLPISNLPLSKEASSDGRSWLLDFD